MSKLLLDKAETAKLILTKKAMNNPPILRVVECIDVSKSMEEMFFDGDVQAAFDQILGAGLLFDDNGEIDVYAFDNKVIPIGVAGAADYEKYVNNTLHPLRHKFFGGTNYAPVIERVEADMFRPAVRTPQPMNSEGGNFFRNLFGMKKPAPSPQQDSNTATMEDASKIPVFAFLMTDGDNQDQQQAEAALHSSSRFDIYWNLVGVGGGSHFKWLQKMADQFDNVGYIKLSGFKLSDDDMYNALLTDEFVTWAKKYPAGNRTP